MFESVECYPLTWPVGWKRTSQRKRSAFKTSFAKARDQLLRELKLMGLGDWNVLISSNIPLRRDGLPYANQANPTDSGVAVYFKYKDKPMVFACDTYINVTDNLWAITKTIEAIRGIQRWGASDMMERAYTGFQALPEAKKEEWWDILRVKRDSSKDVIKENYRRLARDYHPDKGGSAEMMVKLNSAYEEAMK